MDGLGSDPKFADACQRLAAAAPEASIAAVSNLTQLIVDGMVRDHPAVVLEGSLDYDALRSLWSQHERIDPADQHR